MKHLLAAVSLLALACTVHTGEPATLGTHRYHRAHVASCQQALQHGWCGPAYDGCKVKPPQCCQPKNVKCSADGLCSWEGCDGALVFGVPR